MRFLDALFLMVTFPWWPLGVAAEMKEEGTSSSTFAQKTMVRRERNLDHWDSDTLAYYVDEYAGYDIAIMFYAPWDRNSHSLAPYWDRIATLLDAGKSQSRLIMALFDCEANNPHYELCKSLSITHYPTLMFIGSGPYHDTDPLTRTLFGAKRSAGIMGPSPISNTVKFQGNWQHPDSILDWIRTMQALSNWHIWTTKGFGKRLRNFFLPHKTLNTPLPVGIPGGGIANSKNIDKGSESTHAAKIKAMEDKLEKYFNLTLELQSGINQMSARLDSVLAPSGPFQDMFSLMDEEKVWTNDSRSPEQWVLLSCIPEMALDYCQRVSSKVATNLASELQASGKSLDEIIDMPDLEDQLMEKIGKDEPYCAILDNCVVTEFKEEKCRPKTCPFKHEPACWHLMSCLDSDLQREYAEALGVSLTHH